MREELCSGVKVIIAYLIKRYLLCLFTDKTLERYLPQGLIAVRLSSNKNVRDVKDALIESN